MQIELTEENKRRIERYREKESAKTPAYKKASNTDISNWMIAASLADFSDNAKDYKNESGRNKKP